MTYLKSTPIIGSMSNLDVTFDYLIYIIILTNIYALQEGIKLFKFNYIDMIKY